MGFLESISSVLANSFNFRARASRSEYWHWQLFILIMWSGVLAFSIMTSSVKYTFVPNFQMFIVFTVTYLFVVLQPYATFLLLLSMMIIIPNLAVTVRRLHDIGRSGWWFFIILVPYIGPFILFYLTILPSQNGGNKWGGNPSGDNGTSGLQDIYESAVANAAACGSPISQTFNNVMDASVGHNTSNQQRPAMSGGSVTFGKR